MELFLLLEDDEILRSDFFEILEKSSFFQELRDDLPDVYFTKGWKPERKVPEDISKLAEIKRILELAFKVDRWI